MTNEEIISLARTIKNARDLEDVLNNTDHKCGLPLTVAYKHLRWHHAQVGIPDCPEHDGELDRCKAIAEMLGAHHVKLRIDGPDGRQYLDAFIPSDRPEIRQCIRDSLALIGGTICDF